MSEHDAIRRNVLRALAVVPAAALLLRPEVAPADAVTWFKPWVSEVESAAIDRMAFPSPAKPSFIVLPVTNGSDDSNQS